MQCVSLEFYKTRRRYLWLVVGAFVAMLALWLAFSLHDPDEHDRANGWLYLLYCTPILQSVMAPVLVSVLASRLSDIEWKGNTYKLLETFQKPGHIFLCKLLCGSVYLAAYTAIVYALLLTIGTVNRFDGVPQLPYYALSALFSFAVTETLFVFQLLLSMCVRNQVPALAAGLLGAFTALMLLYLPPSAITRLLPWGGFSSLMLAGMDWDPQTRVIEYYSVAPDWTAFLVVCIWLLVFFAAGYRIFSRKEV